MALSRRSVFAGALLAAPLLGSCRPGAGTKPAAGGSKLNALLAAKSIRIAYTNLEPWAFRDPKTGALSGTFVELAQEIFTPLGIKIEFVETQWSTFVAGVQSGQYDVSIVPSYPTIRRAAAVAFTSAVSKLDNTVLVRRGEQRFGNVFDLNKPGVRLVAVDGESSVEFAQSRLKQASLRTFASGDFSLLYSEVITGRADAAFGYVDSIKAFSAQHSEVRDLAPGAPYSTLPISWAVNYSAIDLKEFLNASLAYLKGNGIIDAIERKYAKTP